jgi:multicomponent Na+:H+ antiporter subunit E
MQYIYTFLIMFGFWLLLSGLFDAFHLTLGVLSSGLVAALSGNLFIRDAALPGRLAMIGRFLLYIPWLLREIFFSTLQVAYLAIHPRMLDLIEPTVVTFKTKLTRDYSRVALANSITLTPGTITIRIVEDVFHVHAISRKMAAGLPGEMEERLQRVFEPETL